MTRALHYLDHVEANGFFLMKFQSIILGISDPFGMTPRERSRDNGRKLHESPCIQKTF